ncbi:hypothetical protein GALMADRAFT_1344283 [Galerina marginata CBS 339.88]|uniref:Hydrophobic surface binding protein n=1 Tax=Galerina marginata (strain CBS 339.88) TaxID=685588 RepID=A0A067SPS6_GALM3|nr:hypothetical protein GALMADRAFT_1344283 [Galerina marginata CBS 339.88]
MKLTLKTTFSLLASLVLATSAATVADVSGAIQNITNQFTALDGAINAFPSEGGSVNDILALYAQTVNLAAAVDAGTNAIAATPQPFSEKDSTTLLDGVVGFQPQLQDALNQFVVKRPVLQAIFPCIIIIFWQSWFNLNGGHGRFANSLINAIQPDLVDPATAVKQSLDASFTAVLAAYS